MQEEIQSNSDLPSVLLSILTVPFLLTIILVDNLTNSLIEAGQASEEVFRGERLPILEPEMTDSTEQKY